MMRENSLRTCRGVGCKSLQVGCMQRALAAPLPRICRAARSWAGAGRERAGAGGSRRERAERAGPARLVSPRVTSGRRKGPFRRAQGRGQGLHGLHDYIRLREEARRFGAGLGAVCGALWWRAAAIMRGRSEKAPCRGCPGSVFLWLNGRCQ